MDYSDRTGNEHILQGWYTYAADEVGSVGSWLRLVQERTGRTPAEQQREFGATEDQFLRLRAMRLPRQDQFTSDAQRIALACGIDNPFAFTKVLLLARGIHNTYRTSAPTQGAEHSEQYYMAAFDAQDDLDELPDVDAAMQEIPPETESK
jgi:hypothetical protein